MRKHFFIWLFTFGILAGLTGGANVLRSQQPTSETVPVSVVVTVEPKHGKDVPSVDHKEDVRAFEGKEKLSVTDWVPLQGSHANLELLILIDESAGQSVANQFEDVKRFMSSQPPTTTIGVGYIEYGTVRMAQNFTTDHAAAGKALRIPIGPAAGGNSPYLSVTDAMKKWQGSQGAQARRAIFLISDGIDPLQPGLIDSYLDQAVDVAQQTGTQISSIYVAGLGHYGHSFWRINQGQNNLSELADKTGGEAYFQGFSTPVSFSPFLDEYAERLNHQYLLTFLIKPDKKPSYHHVRLETEIPNAELDTADRVYVPSAK